MPRCGSDFFHNQYIEEIHMTTEYESEFDDLGIYCWGDCGGFLPKVPIPGKHPFLCDDCNKRFDGVSPMMKERLASYEETGACPDCGTKTPHNTMLGCQSCRIILYQKRGQMGSASRSRLSVVQIAERVRAREDAKAAARAANRVVKTCPVCGKSFNPIGAQICCSPTCKSVSRAENRLVKVCPVCGKSFNPTGAQICCSPTCKAAYQRGPCPICGNYDPANRTCPTCGKKFKPAGLAQMHCSAECAWNPAWDGFGKDSATPAHTMHREPNIIVRLSPEHIVPVNEGVVRVPDADNEDVVSLEEGTE